MSVFTNTATAAPDQAGQYIAAILGLLGDRDPFDVLRQTPALLARRLSDLPAAEIRRPEAPGKWSVGAVVQHLADSELVWGYRARMILAHDRPPIIGYDQDLFAERLHYDQADAPFAVEQFRVLRESNLRLVGRASPAERLRFGVHAERGEESIDQLIRLNAGHDLLHLRQIDRVRAAIGR